MQLQKHAASLKDHSPNESHQLVKGDNLGPTIPSILKILKKMSGESKSYFGL